MLLHILNRTEVVIICILLMLMTLLVLVDVVMRFGFNSVLMWSQDLTLNMSAGMLLFGASYGLKIGGHVVLNAFVNFCPSFNLRILKAIVAILSLIYCGLILYGSWLYLKMMKMIGIHLVNMAIPAMLAHSLLLLGYLFLVIRLLIILLAVVERNTK